MPRASTARSRLPRRRAIAKVVIAPFTLAALAACSLVVNHASSQCGTDADCAKFPGTSCVQGGCVVDTAVPEAGLLDISAEGPAEMPCTSTQDCLAAHGGIDWVCQQPGQVCVPLTSAECPYVAGDYTGDDALIFGAILPLYGAHASTGAMLANAVQLGLNDFVGGLPATSDGGPPRHVAVVFCDESHDVIAAATHLRDIPVPAILGTGESATTLEVVDQVTYKSGQFLITPRATVDLSAYQSSGTVWRTCASDAVEGAALAALAGSVARDVKAQSGLASVALAILHATDTESTELDATLQAALATDGGSMLDVSYGDPDTDQSSAAEFAQAITQVTTSEPLPEVVVILGSTQAVRGALGGLESTWPGGARRPVYVLSSGMQTTELLDLVAGNAPLAARVLGTAPGQNDTTYANLARFLALYDETFADGGAPVTFGVAQTYDAFYTLVYAGTTARNIRLIGKDIDVALGVLLAGADAVAPVHVDVGPSGIGAAFAAIAAGDKVALEGASAPLAFDVKTGNLVTDVQVWCIAQGGSTYVASGLSYSAASGQLTGALTNGCSD